MKLPSFSDIFYPLERFVLLAIHVEPVDLETADGQLADGEVDGDAGVCVLHRAPTHQAHSSTDVGRLRLEMSYYMQCRYSNRSIAMRYFIYGRPIVCT